MPAEAAPLAAAGSVARLVRRAGVVCILLILVWLGCGLWHSVKPLPPGTHVASLSVRLAESEVEFIDDSVVSGATLQRELAAVGRADQIIVLEDCPLSPDLEQRLVLRKRQRPNLKIVFVTDPRTEYFGGTPAQVLSNLEAIGVIVARTRLERLRDSDPLYSSLWRLTMAWWSDSFDDPPGESSLGTALRMRNLKADERHLLVADDGAGGWTSLVLSTAPQSGDRPPTVAVEIRGHLAHAIGSSALQVAQWSVDDERLPATPPEEGPGVGTIDARLFTEGAIPAELRDLLAAAGHGDSISVVGRALAERSMLDALLQAGERGASLQVLLDPELPQNRAVAGELLRQDGQQVEVRWQTPLSRIDAGFLLMRHRADAWLAVGASNFTRRALDDQNLSAAVELHMPVRALPARAAADFFSRAWSRATAYEDHADSSAQIYWRYRLSEATGLALF
jgi:hypothetical protein